MASDMLLENALSVLFGGDQYERTITLRTKLETRSNTRAFN
jgi:hypothetical protein